MIIVLVGNLLTFYLQLLLILAMTITERYIKYAEEIYDWLVSTYKEKETFIREELEEKWIIVNRVDTIIKENFLRTDH